MNREFCFGRGPATATATAYDYAHLSTIVDSCEEITLIVLKAVSPAKIVNVNCERCTHPNALEILARRSMYLGVGRGTRYLIIVPGEW